MSTLTNQMKKIVQNRGAYYFLSTIATKGSILAIYKLSNSQANAVSQKVTELINDELALRTLIADRNDKKSAAAAAEARHDLLADRLEDGEAHTTAFVMEVERLGSEARGLGYAADTLTDRVADAIRNYILNFEGLA